MHLAKEMVRRVLSDAQRQQFVRDGFVKLEGISFRDRGRGTRDPLERHWVRSRESRDMGSSGRPPRRLCPRTVSPGSEYDRASCRI